MGDSRLGLVMIHGIMSGPMAWGPLRKLIASDGDLGFVDTLAFGYETGLRRVNPLKVFPSIDTVADSLKEYLATEAGDYERLVLVTHSQGGLVAQRYLARMLHDGRGRELARIRRVVMLACPNNGSELLLSLRRNVLGLRHPQEKDLRPLNEQVSGTLRTVMRDVVHARTGTERTCPIAVSVYAGESDRVVTPASAQSVFPDSAVLPGGHSSILMADSPRHRTFTTVRRLILTTPVERLAFSPQLPPSTASSYVETGTVTCATGGDIEGHVIQDHTMDQRPAADTVGKFENGFAETEPSRPSREGASDAKVLRRMLAEENLEGYSTDIRARSSRRHSNVLRTVLVVVIAELILMVLAVVWWNGGHVGLDAEGEDKPQPLTSVGSSGGAIGEEATKNPMKDDNGSSSSSPSLNVASVKPKSEHKFLSMLSPDSTGDSSELNLAEARIGGRDYPNSLWDNGCSLTDVITVTDYSLASKYSRFTATVGIEGEDGAVGTFGLKADGKEIGTWVATRDHVAKIDVDINGVERLTLSTVDRKGDPLYCTVDSFIWGDPTLTVKP